MTATKELHRLLDERGVEWWNPIQMEGSVFTRWNAENGTQWTASEVIHGNGKLRIGTSHVTPEQAVEATLGRDDVFTREDVESAFVSGYSLGTLPAGSDPAWDQNRQTVEEHMEELGWVRKEAVAARWDGNVLILTTPRDPSSIHVQRAEGQPRKVYAGEMEAIAATLGGQPSYDELIEALRRDWHIEASWDGLRRFWYIGLTEEGVRKRDERDRLKAENAKLRELLHDMWQFTGTACKKYPELFDPAAQGGQMVMPNMLRSFKHRMRELGVEV